MPYGQLTCECVLLINYYYLAERRFYVGIQAHRQTGTDQISCSSSEREFSFCSSWKSSLCSPLKQAETAVAKVPPQSISTTNEKMIHFLFLGKWTPCTGLYRVNNRQLVFPCFASLFSTITLVACVEVWPGRRVCGWGKVRLVWGQGSTFSRWGTEVIELQRACNVNYSAVMQGKQARHIYVDIFSNEIWSFYTDQVPLCLKKGSRAD